MLILAKNTSNSQSQTCDRAISERTAEPPITAKLAPASHRSSREDRYWLMCNHVGKQFGGLYYRDEVDSVLAHFRGRSRLIEPHEFEIAAARAIQQRNQQIGVMS